ncbi:hypothetical protein [Flavilitoribacter nigricans]|uniref:Uncharacterized protein n=1 Tax=Flavilitoribacter nigricans (strain ATCC 23147 / DSM 23189 / NBRC 102662 / NCIMB 1420 / SS-2) TaxID=1122177 RepID=A0A2D0MY93_FLAN2|nr:hypothetical protein [Flavilitoribacter nigricans]PHN01252.1 hypothetical protein CRP01_37880 [Flavilitoribacter nigricans DSM 23189 = NBRC 102662]
MKKESKPKYSKPSDHRDSGSKLFGRIPIPSFGRKDRIPVRKAGDPSGGRWTARHLLWLAGASLLVLIFLQKCKSVATAKAKAELIEQAYDNILFRHQDCDYLVYEATSMCGHPLVLTRDYREYQEAEARRDQSTEGVQEDSQTKNYIRQRPKINLDRLVYFEKLTRGRARLVYDNGACEISELDDLLFNIQEAELCARFPGIPQNGEVNEFVNLLYIESFDKVRCEGKELYRAQLGVSHSSCAVLRTIRDCGVGLFSVYVYRNLRKKLEALNPHVDFKYRRTLELVGCEC